MKENKIRKVHGDNKRATKDIYQKGKEKVSSHARTGKDAHTHTRTHARIHTHSHTHTHTHTHTNSRTSS